MTTKTMNHSQYPKDLKAKTDEQLRFIIKDANAAMAAMPDNPNNSYYADEVCYCADELHRRSKTAAPIVQAVEPN